MKIKSDPQKLLKELEYYIRYYGNEYKQNQGLDIIIGVIKKYSQIGSWLDLGGGSNTPFWKMFFPKLNRIVSADISQEAFVLSKLIVNEFYESPCYSKTRELFGTLNNDDIKIEYIRMNLLSEEIFFDNYFDNITQFGLLGLMKTEQEFINKTKEILRYLKENGVYIGVNWIFSKSYQEKMGFDNTYICKKSILSAETNSIKLIYYKVVDIQNDANYDRCIIYIMKNKG